MPHAEEASIRGALNFYSPDAWPADQPRAIHLGTVGDKLRKHEPHEVELRDIRTAGKKFSLDENGFQFLTNATSLQVPDFDNDELVKETYYAECADLIKSFTGASAVHIFSHMIRRVNMIDVIKEAEEAYAKEGPNGFIKRVHPAPSCHVDQSYKGAEAVVRVELPEQAEEILKHRWSIINIWRPIKPVKRDPLVVCDWQTVDPDKDLVELDQILPPRTQHDTYGRHSDPSHVLHMNRWEVAYNHQQKWYLASDMQPEECFLIKCFDSSTNGTARCCPHAAFQQVTDQGPPRESIEVRCLAIWND